MCILLYKFALTCERYTGNKVSLLLIISFKSSVYCKCKSCNRHSLLTL